MEKKREVLTTYYTYNYCPTCDIIMDKTFVHSPPHPLLKYTCSICEHMEVTPKEYPIVEVVFKEEL
jgi:hypothetical protein